MDVRSLQNQPPTHTIRTALLTDFPQPVGTRDIMFARYQAGGGGTNIYRSPDNGTASEARFWAVMPR